MPGASDLTVILSKTRPETDQVEVDNLYIFLKKSEGRPFRFLIDKDVPKKIGEPGSQIYPGLGEKEKGFILHNNELYFIDNAATEGAEKKLETPDGQKLEFFEVDLRRPRELSFDEVLAICRLTHFTSNSIKSEFSTDPVRVLYRLNQDDKPTEIAVNNWPEMKSGEITSLIKALQSLESETPIPISAELEKKIKKAFMANSVKEIFDLKAAEEEKLRIRHGKHYLEKLADAREFREESDLLKVEVELYNELLNPADQKTPKKIDYTGKFQEKFQSLEKEIEQLKKTLKSPESKLVHKKMSKYLEKIVKYSDEFITLTYKLDKRIEDLKATMGPPKKLTSSPLKKSRSLFSPAFFKAKPKTFDDIDKKIDRTEDAIKKLQSKIEARRNQKDSPPSPSNESIDNSFLSLSHREFRSPSSPKSPKSAFDKRAKLQVKPRSRSHK